MIRNQIYLVESLQKKFVFKLASRHVPRFAVCTSAVLASTYLRTAISLSCVLQLDRGLRRILFGQELVPQGMQCQISP